MSTTENQAPDPMPDTVEDKPRPKAPALAVLLLASILVIGVTAAVVMGGGDSKGAIRREAEDYAIRNSRVAAPTAPEREVPRPTEDRSNEEKPDPESQRRIEQLAARMAEAERQAQLDEIRRERERAQKQQEEARKRLEDRRRSSILVASSPSPDSTAAASVPAGAAPAGAAAANAALDPFAALSAAQAAQQPAAAAPAPFAFLPSPAAAAPDTVTAGLYGDPAWRINQGKFLHGVLETRISSELPGSVRAIVSRDTYSEDGSQVLVPAGSRLTGEYRASVTRGQSRVGVIWHRIARPDGVDVLISAPGTDRLGVSGVAGDVDTHWWERFGGSVLLSLIDAYGQDQSNEAVSIVAGDGGNAAAIALQNSINIAPTITVDQGTEINIFVHQDIDFSQTRITRRP